MLDCAPLWRRVGLFSPIESGIGSRVMLTARVHPGEAYRRCGIGWRQSLLRGMRTLWYLLRDGRSY